MHKPGVSAAVLRDELTTEYQRRGALPPGESAGTDGDFSFSISSQDRAGAGDLAALSQLSADQWTGTVKIVSQAPGI